MSTAPVSNVIPRLALVGNPNCGKTALFNLLTGSRQKVANYAGVTVERKVGLLRTSSGQTVEIIDLPGTYSLEPLSQDERVTRDVIAGQFAGEAAPDLLIAVVDATNLPINLRLVLELKALGRPMVLALNMIDVLQRQGGQIDLGKLAQELGFPVVETVAVKSGGHASLLHYIEQKMSVTSDAQSDLAHLPVSATDRNLQSLFDMQKEVRRILAVAAPELLANRGDSRKSQHKIDRVLMHPVWGLTILAAVLFLIFQAVFSWAAVPMDAIEAAMGLLSAGVQSHMAEGPLRSLLVDGVIGGVGSVLIFLPQILVLFFFILILEDSGYLPRAAFLLDRLMGHVGLSGRAFIPLLSSFACAIPGIMATRSISNWRDRLATIMIAPLMTCSARLPIYALLIGAFIPKQQVAGLFNLQGLTLFGLYVVGVVSAMAVGWVMKRFWMKSDYQPLMLELPPYRMLNLRNLVIGLWERARIFLMRVGTIIFTLTILMWFLASYPHPPTGAAGAAIEYSFAGMMGHMLEKVFAPIGFNWQISIALVPGLAAREVAVGALATVYALSAPAQEAADTLAPLIAQQWSFATACALLAWFVFAPQCLSTLAVVRRETNSWRYPAFMMIYLFALAYLAAGVTYHVVKVFT
jgi:ferrous iron transport protein B